MPRFFFHIYDDMVSKDEEGRELPSAEAAKDAAIHGARELMCDELRKGKLTLHHRLEVEDESGNRLFVVPFRELVRVED